MKLLLFGTFLEGNRSERTLNWRLVDKVHTIMHNTAAFFGGSRNARILSVVEVQSTQWQKFLF